MAITITKTEATKVWQFYLNGDWHPLPQIKGSYNRMRDYGYPIRILHNTGGYVVVANADKLPEEVPTSFSTKTPEEKELWEVRKQLHDLNVLFSQTGNPIFKVEMEPLMNRREELLELTANLDGVPSTPIDENTSVFEQF